MRHGFEGGDVRGQGFAWEWLVTVQGEGLCSGLFLFNGFFSFGLVKVFQQLSWDQKMSFSQQYLRFCLPHEVL